MKLEKSLLAAVDCGLETLGEAVYNIEMHSGSLFSYYDINTELKELHNQADELKNTTNFTDDSSVESVLNYLEIEDDGVAETELKL